MQRITFFRKFLAFLFYLWASARMDEKHQPHDSITKFVLKDKERMLEFLSALVFSYLPECITGDLILEEAVREDTAHISPELAKYYSDVLFSVPLRSGGFMRLYFLIEHKSYHDRAVPFQILKNMTAIYEEKESGKGAQWPVIGILFYHGRQKWDVSLSFQERLGFSKAIRQNYGRFIPDFEYVAIKVREERLVERVQPILIKTFLIILLIADSKDQAEEFTNFFREGAPLRETKDGLLYFDTLLGYAKIVYKGELSTLAKKIGDEMGIEMGNMVMTGGEQYYRECIATGLATGRDETALFVAQNLAEEGASKERIEKITGFSWERLVELGVKQT